MFKKGVKKGICILLLISSLFTIYVLIGAVPLGNAQIGYGPRADELDILFYSNEEAAFAGMMAGEIDLMNAKATRTQLELVPQFDSIQLPGIAFDFYRVRRHTWAVLISGGWNSSKNYARYWNDLGECYMMLKEKGYTDDEIFVLYADGNKPSSNNCNDPENVFLQYNNMVIDYNATNYTLQLVCNEIASNSTENDTLFVFVTDHGAAGGYLCLWNETKIHAMDFGETFATITQYKFRLFLLEQCYGGTFIDRLANSKTIIATATNATEWSWSCDGGTPLNQPLMRWEGPFDEFSYHFIAALRGRTPWGVPVNVDSDGNGIVSIWEVFDHANKSDSRRYLKRKHPYKGDISQWSDEGDLGSAPFPSGHWALVPKSNRMYGVHYMTFSPEQAGPDNYWTFLRANSTEGSIRYGLASIPEAMNIITSSNEADWDCLNRIYDTLLTFSPYDPSIRTGLRPRMAWNWKIENWTKQATNESLRKEFIGFGEEAILAFYIQTSPLIEYSETIYVDGEPMTREVNYTIDYVSGFVNFTVPPPLGSLITADYQAPCTKVTFYLRNNIVWHDGIACTAEDVYFTISYIKSFGEVAYNYPLVKNVHHTEVLDPYIIAIYEDTLNLWTLWWIGSLPIIPQHIFENITDPIGYTPGGLPPEQVLIGCGPWKYAELVPSDFMRLTANRNYYLITPPLGEIDFYMQVDYEPINPKEGYKITILDIVRICAAYGSQGYEIPDENFDPGCDINPGGHTCTINILDLVIACIQYGETWGTSGIPPS